MPLIFCQENFKRKIAGNGTILVSKEMIQSFDSWELKVVLWNDGCIHGRVYERDEFAALPEERRSEGVVIDVMRYTNGEFRFEIPEVFRESDTFFFEKFRKKVKTKGEPRLEPVMVMFVGRGDHFELWPWKG